MFSVQCTVYRVQCAVCSSNSKIWYPLINTKCSIRYNGLHSQILAWDKWIGECKGGDCPRINHAYIYHQIYHQIPPPLTVQFTERWSRGLGGPTLPISPYLPSRHLVLADNSYCPVVQGREGESRLKLKEIILYYCYQRFTVYFLIKQILLWWKKFCVCGWKH